MLSLRTLLSSLLLFSGVFSGVAPAQTLQRVKLDTRNPTALGTQLEQAGFDVLSVGNHVEVVVNPTEKSALLGLGFQPVLLETGRSLRRILAEQEMLDGVPSGYLDLAQIYAQMAQTALDHPTLCQVVDLSATFGAPLTAEGRSLMALKISDNVALDEDEPAVLIASAHHCREIVTPVIALAVIDRLTDEYGTVPSVTQAVNDHEIWIVPVTNPDGYEFVFNGNNLWRKNRRVFPSAIGVDLNRNYPQGWDNSCSGSTSQSSNTYKGPSAASEPETQAILALSEARRFAKVLDFHSSGREVLWGYACPTHPFDSYYQAEATAISQASGYMGDERRPSADGEHQQWHHARRGAWSVLIEVATSFQPSFASAQAEAAQVLGGIDWMLARSIPLNGHVTNACSGAPVDAEISIVGITLPQGEENRSGGAFGRWHANLPPATYTLRFEAPGFTPVQAQVSVTAGGANTLDVQMIGSTAEEYCVANTNSTGQVGHMQFVGVPSITTNNVSLSGSQLPAGQFCLFIYGQTENQLPAYDGILCFSNPIIRHSITLSDPFGQTSTPFDLSSPVQPNGQILAGTTWNFQIFYRDTGFGATGANLTLPLRVTFCP